jgi:CRP/FNR family cyclic AMP-dependent transcriptional regulator
MCEIAHAGLRACAMDRRTRMVPHESESRNAGKVGLFRSLDAAAIRGLDTQCTWRRASRDAWIVDHQDVSNDVFFVVSGSVRVKIQSVAGREILPRDMNAGEFSGELAAIDNQPRSSGNIAMTDVTIARMPASVFRTVLVHPDVCHQLLTLMAGYIRTLSNRINEFTTLDVRHRIYAELLRLSRPETTRSKRAVISPPPPHADIAARVSTRRESVTREFKVLERGGLIERRRGAIVLTDTEWLRRLIEEASERD